MVHGYFLGAEKSQALTDFSSVLDIKHPQRLSCVLASAEQRQAGGGVTIHIQQ